MRGKARAQNRLKSNKVRKEREGPGLKRKLGIIVDKQKGNETEKQMNTANARDDNDINADNAIRQGNDDG